MCSKCHRTESRPHNFTALSLSCDIMDHFGFFPSQFSSRFSTILFLTSKNNNKTIKPRCDGSHLLISIVRGLRQENCHEFKTDMGSSVWPCLKTTEELDIGVLNTVLKYLGGSGREIRNLSSPRAMYEGWGQPGLPEPRSPIRVGDVAYLPECLPGTHKALDSTCSAT